ncbi:MAG: hypothetical protein UV73_C0014G0028 [Candidatus Gottesmanbacteria bacterium GW2011_GWA2_43_14]|uniref:DUF5678 domain-containing protein n=1 Tax=Candidatus Gottesmanbacteria bacterium GW2011_GWA2_43_14 TaxID=1618443 RepID=A0A0G1FL22_9BACT|nr:MAG: hypothetical protein UV73_C0014G0028 [Candidatus Gottesmanbacteria bacterium GW2011_GWA2_43_14]
MKNISINFIKLLKDYPQKGWVAISSDFDRVVLHGKTLREIRNKAKKTDEKVFFFPTGEKYSHFTG